MELIIIAGIYVFFTISASLFIFAISAGSGSR